MVWGDKTSRFGSILIKLLSKVPVIWSNSCPIVIPTLDVKAPKPVFFICTLSISTNEVRPALAVLPITLILPPACAAAPVAV